MSVTYLAGVAEKIREFFSGFMGALIAIIPKLVYFLCTLIFQILDILQLLVRKVAGLDVVNYSSSTILGDAGTASTETGDIVLRFIRTIFTGDNAILSNIFWSLIILGLIMLIITTFVAVLRSEYAATDAKSASKGKIVGKAFKAIASFAIVPIVCFFGIYLSNIILQALDTITSGTSSTQLGTTYTDSSGTTYSIANLFEQYTTKDGQKTYITYNFYGDDVGDDKDNSTPTTSTPISGLIFKASAYKANRIRNSSTFQNHLSSPSVGAGVFNQYGNKYSDAADLLDECYANAYSLKTEANLQSNDDFEADFLYPFGGKSSFIGNYPPSSFKTFDKNNVQQVWYYYDLWSFNFVICIGGLVIAAKLLIYLCFGLMKRIFELVVLFLIAAPISSLMPLDDGAALKKWREKFTSKVIAAYGPIVGLNLFFVILPFITEIRFFDIPFVDEIVNVFFVIVGLIMVKDLCGTISELIGGDDAMKAGEGMASEVGSTIGKIGQVAAFPAGMAVKGVKTANNIRKKVTGGIRNKVDKHRQKEAENEAVLESLDDKTRMEIETSSSGARRRKLRSLRKGMSGEQRLEAREKYDAKRAKEKEDKKEEKYLKGLEKDPATSIAGRRSERIYNERAKSNLRLSTIQANGYTAKEWNKLSSIKKRKLMNEEQKNRAGDYDVKDLKRADEKQLKKLERQANRADKAFTKENDRALNTSNKRNRKYDELFEKDPDKALKFRHTTDKRVQKQMVKSHKAFEKANSLDSQVDEAKNRLNRDYSREIENKKGDALARKEANVDTARNMQRLNESGGYIKSGQMGLDINDAKKFGKAMGQGFKDVVDNLSPLFSALGANLAKGFKDAGGFKALEHRMAGHSGKEEKVADEIKNQKRILAAQDEASKLLGRGGGGSSKIQLDDETIKKLSTAIADAMPKK